jgi:hypothetical protein
MSTHLDKHFKLYFNNNIVLSEIMIAVLAKHDGLSLLPYIV